MLFKGIITVLIIGATEAVNVNTRLLSQIYT